MTEGPEYRRFFARTPASLRNARKSIVEFARKWLSGSDLFDFEVGAGEALASVVEHGGGQTIVVTCSCEGDRVVVEIEDRGRGFEFGANDSDVIRADVPRGYGFLLMRKFLDSVEFLDNGRRLRLMKRSSIRLFGRGTDRTG